MSPVLIPIHLPISSSANFISCVGNIRVYVRVRPPLPNELASNAPTAAVAFPDKRDHREIALTSSSSTATGTERVDTALFSFDRVFEPRASQGEVFEDIGQLVQSVTDGYNCTIFSYGQTGSGKTWTMEGGKTPETIGMIPRAVKQVFQTAESARAQGWDYTMEGQFLEIVCPSLPPFSCLVDCQWCGGSTMKRSTIFSGRENLINASTRLNMIRADGRLSLKSSLVRAASFHCCTA